VAQRLTVPAAADELLVKTDVTDMDPGGHFVSGAYRVQTGSGPRRWVAVRWTDGEPELLASSDAELRANGVNEHGWLVGAGERFVEGDPASDAADFAWVFTGDELPAAPVAADELPVVILPTPEGAVSSAASAITESGEIAGVIAFADATAAAVWSPAAGGGYTVRVLAGPGHAVAYDIGADGMVVGVAGGRPYVWGPDGTGRALPLPADAVSGHAGRVHGDRAYGRVAFAPGEGGAMLAWDLRTDEVVSVAPDDRAPLGTGNARGDVAFLGDEGAVLQRGDRVDALPPPEGTQWSIRPVAMSEDGTVVAGVSLGSNGVLWRC
jgi:hypothetical protein